MFISTLLMTIGMAVTAQPAPRATSAGDAVIPVCQVVSIERQEVPGADAGVLTEMIAYEGMIVTKYLELARVDDREAKAQLLVKQADYEAAEQEANSDIGVKYQEATADVAKAALEKLRQANKGATGAVSEIEILRTKLEWDKAKLGILKEREKNIADHLTAKAKKAEVDVAKIGVERRVLRAPFDGVVLKVKKHVGEWVANGEPVLEVVRVDRLSIRGGLIANEWTPADIEGRNVTVEVMLPRGRVEKVPGKVVFVSPVVEGQRLNVWAEIESPVDKDGRRLVPAGLTAMMTIQVSQPAKTEARPVSAPRGTPPTKATTKK
jgi:multidrug efflux pump subunit AcrA (membrane-fusion protein)